MNPRVEVPALPDVDAAIMRVLQAEQDARAEVERCARAAERQVETAQQRARGIAERAARRVATVHRWTDRMIAARLAELERERAGLRAAGPAVDDSARLARAVEALADELAGTGP